MNCIYHVKLEFYCMFALSNSLWSTVTRYWTINILIRLHVFQQSFKNSTFSETHLSWKYKLNIYFVVTYLSYLEVKYINRWKQLQVGLVGFYCSDKGLFTILLNDWWCLIYLSMVRSERGGEEICLFYNVNYPKRKGSYTYIVLLYTTRL